MKTTKLIILFFVVANLIIAQQEKVKSLSELKSEIVLNQDILQTNVQFQSQLEKKKAGLAILYSLLLPGMGELYAGDYSFGKYLTVADGVFWGALFGFSIYGDRMENNYKNFAITAGGADISGKNEKYFADIGNYLDIDQYNRRQELDRNFIEVYKSNTHYWKWDDQAEREEYRGMWKSSENAVNNIRFAAGALILNRIVSVINAVRLVSKHNKNVEENMSWNLSFGVDNKLLLPPQLMMNFKTSF